MDNSGQYIDRSWIPKLQKTITEKKKQFKKLLVVIVMLRIDSVVQLSRQSRADNLHGISDFLNLSNLSCLMLSKTRFERFSQCHDVDQKFNSNLTLICNIMSAFIDYNALSFTK